MNEEEQAYVEGLSREMERQAVYGGEYPETPQKDTQLQFMRDVVEEEDSLKQAKTGNLEPDEAGKTNISVLDYHKIARYADSEGLDNVAEFLRDQALLVPAVSLGRKAKIIDALFTVRRETRNLGTLRTTEKKGLFGTTTVREGE